MLQRITNLIPSCTIKHKNCCAKIKTRPRKNPITLPILSNKQKRAYVNIIIISNNKIACCTYINRYIHLLHRNRSHGRFYVEKKRANENTQRKLQNNKHVKMKNDSPQFSGKTKRIATLNQFCYICMTVVVLFHTH